MSADRAPLEGRHILSQHFQRVYPCGGWIGPAACNQLLEVNGLMVLFFGLFVDFLSETVAILHLIDDPRRHPGCGLSAGSPLGKGGRWGGGPG